MKENPYYLNIERIREFLPHRAPMLLVDRVLEIVPTGDLSSPLAAADKEGTRVVAIKNISFNEPAFRGHFPEFPLFPGVLILETMAQAGCFSLYPYMAKEMAAPKEYGRTKHDFQCILVGVENARFRKQVVPGDCLRIEAVLKKCRKHMWVFECKGLVDGQLVAEADILANVSFKGAS
jgi:3-hydroxyacyl-[acyl-carrier-protein] dehydratase